MALRFNILIVHIGVSCNGSQAAENYSKWNG